MLQPFARFIIGNQILVATKFACNLLNIKHVLHCDDVTAIFSILQYVSPAKFGARLAGSSGAQHK